MKTKVNAYSINFFDEHCNKLKTAQEEKNEYPHDVLNVNAFKIKRTTLWGKNIDVRNMHMSE